MAKASWYRLDNIGKFYASQAGRSGQTVFRFAADMADDVDADALQDALADAVAMYPSFNVMLRSGLFWHYLEQSQSIPTVEPESHPVCFRLHAGPESVLFRVSYYRTRINLEVSHIISDGRGTFEFFKAIVGLYIERRYGATGACEPATDTDERKSEDSFTKNYEKKRAGSTKLPRAYHIKGWKDEASPTFMEYHLPASEVYREAKAMGVSVTSLIVAAIACAVRESMGARSKKRAVCMDVPVDLRRFFGSGTMRNFFGLAYVVCDFEDAVALADVAKSVQAQILTATSPDAIKRRMNRMVKLEKNPVLRASPLFLKDIALELASRVSARDVTTTASSIGRIELPEPARPFVRSVSVLTSTRGLNFVACTYADDLCIGISSAYVSHDVVRNFCRMFSSMGIAGHININKDDASVHLALKQAHLEHLLTHRDATAAEKGDSR